MNFVTQCLGSLSFAAVWDHIWCYFCLIPKIMYLLANSFLTVLDIFQMLFRKLAGLDVYFVDGTPVQGDIVYQFISGIVMGGEYPMLTTVFWALIALGIILLFLSTIIAVIRSEYTTDISKAENGKGKIIGKAFKSLAYFAIVPIVCLFGVYLSNVVLRAVDAATSGTSQTSSILLDEGKADLLQKYTEKIVDVGPDIDVPIIDVNLQTKVHLTNYDTYAAYNLFGIPVGTTSTTFSGVIFKAAAYEANRVRTTLGGLDIEGQGQDRSFYQLLQLGGDYVTNFSGLFTTTTNDPDVLANYIDEAFAANVQLAKSEKLIYNEAVPQFYNQNLKVDAFALGQQDHPIKVIDRYNVTLVWYFYNLWHFNWIIAFGAGIIMSVVFINIIIGLMRRIIELIGLFLISPPLVALMPMDDGKAYGEWRKSFISKTLSAYGAVAGMNIFFIILPYLNEINFFNIEIIDRIVDTLIIIVGLVAIKHFVGLISGFIGAENAEEAGGKISKEVGNAVAKAGMATAAAATIGGRAAGAAVKVGGRVIGLAGKTIGTRIPAVNRRLIDAETKRRVNARKPEEAAAAEHAVRAAAERAQGYRFSESEWEKYKNTEQYQKDFDSEVTRRATAHVAAHSPVSRSDVIYHPLKNAGATLKESSKNALKVAKSTAFSVGRGVGGYFQGPIVKPFFKSLNNMGEMMYEPFKKSDFMEPLKDLGKNTLSVLKGQSALDRIIRDAVEEQRNSLKNQQQARKEIGLNYDNF